MSDFASTPGPDDEGGRRRIFDRWGRQIIIGSVLVIMASIGVAAWVLGSNSATVSEVLVEAADSVGADPFTTDGIRLAAGSTDAGGKSPGLFGGTGDNGVCDPEMLVAFLRSHPDKAQAWVDALNADPTLKWSGGSRLAVSDISAYVSELHPAVLTRDTRVTNHGFKDGQARPRQSLLRKGTAVLVDDAGDPRVRCFCGNPLHPQAGDEPVALASAGTPTPSTDDPTPTPSAEPSPTNECIPDTPETDGCGPEPTAIDCDPVGPVPATATDISTAPIDLDGTGPAETLLVYLDAGAWHVRVEAGVVGLQDDILTGPGPAMAAIGGASVDNIPFDEAWVKVGSGSSTDIVGLIVFRDCTLHRLQLDGNPAEFPVGLTATAADGVACYGFDTGIEVFTTTSTDGVTYTGTSSIYTIDPGSFPLSLVLGSTANQSQTTADGPSFTSLHSFQCDSLNTIP